jgi:hypothetical protein
MSVRREGGVHVLRARLIPRSKASVPPWERFVTSATAARAIAGRRVVSSRRAVHPTLAINGWSHKKTRAEYPV